MNFKEWIIQFANEDSPRGDLAYDIKRDEMFPREANSKEAILDYLDRRRACRECVQAFKKAWNEYSRG